MNIQKYNDQPYTLEELYDEFDHRDRPSFDEFSKYRFLWIVNENDSYYGGDIHLIYEYEDHYYLVRSDHCSCNSFAWDPEESELPFLYKLYPDLDIEKECLTKNNESQR